MRDARTPCNDPDADPNDWFIEKDGRQYSDEPLVTLERAEAWLEEYKKNHPDGPPAPHIDYVMGELEHFVIKENLIKRRHAKDDCHTSCYFRTQCLEIGMAQTSPPTHGIWGGYYPEELRSLRSLRAERLSRRRSVDS